MVRGAYLAYLTIVGGALGWLLHRDPDTYRYIPASIRKYPGAKAVARLMESRGFSRAVHVPVLGGLMAIHQGPQVASGACTTSTRQVVAAKGSSRSSSIERLRELAGVALVRVEDAPASRSDADYNFISNEVFVVFATEIRHETVRRLGFLPGSRAVSDQGDDDGRAGGGPGGACPTSARPTTPTRGCCSTCGPSASFRRTRPAATSWSSSSGSTKPAPEPRPPR